jgi:cytoskeletal protein RodZ
MGTIHGIRNPSGSVHRASQRKDPATFGEWFEQVRKARGLTLDDIHQETKISLRHLEILEHGELAAIPAFYRRAEVRAIARAVGVDEQLAIRRLNTATASLAPPPEEPADEEAAPPWPNLISAPAFVAVAFVMMLAAAGIGEAVLGWMAAGAPPRTSNAAAPSTSARESVPATAELLVLDKPGTSGLATTPEQTPPSPPPDSAAPAPVAAAAASPDAAPAALADAEIVVRTVPPGAYVTVNGISWGVSPVTIRNLPPGAKRVRATKEGFAASERTFALGDGQHETLNLRLANAK